MDSRTIMSRFSFPDFAPLPLPPLPDEGSATFFQSAAADDLSALDTSLGALDHHLAAAGDGLESVTNANAALASSLADGASQLQSLINEQAAASVDSQLADALATEAKLAALADNSDSLLDPAPVFSYRAVPVLDTQPDLGSVPVIVSPPPSGGGTGPPPPLPPVAGAPAPCPEGFVHNPTTGNCDPVATGTQPTTPAPKPPPKPPPVPIVPPICYDEFGLPGLCPPTGIEVGGSGACFDEGGNAVPCTPSLPIQRI